MLGMRKIERVLLGKLLQASKKLQSLFTEVEISRGGGRRWLNSEHRRGGTQGCKV
jgi:hypothetical protein